MHSLFIWILRAKRKIHIFRWNLISAHKLMETNFLLLFSSRFKVFSLTDRNTERMKNIIIITIIKTLPVITVNREGGKTKTKTSANRLPLNVQFPQSLPVLWFSHSISIDIIFAFISSTQLIFSSKTNICFFKPNERLMFLILLKIFWNQKIGAQTEWRTDRADRLCSSRMR